MSNILAIVDDEATFRLRFKLILQKTGISTQNFVDLETSDQLVSSYTQAKTEGKPFNVLFLDINLKGSKLNGLELLKKVRTELNGSPIIAIISTSTNKDEIELAKTNGANCYIVKSGDLVKFSERMTAFKQDYLVNKTKDFKVYGA